MRLVQSVIIALAAVGVAVGSAEASAQVIEIGDSGETRTFNGPTRFVSGPAEPVDSVPAAVKTVANGVDSFERAARSENVDVHLLRALAWTESGGRANAVSPKGALGVMQLMPATAAELGVNPLDADANISGGARYFARQLSRFQSVPLALAAYNAGPGAVLRWRGIPPYAETQAYVASIMSRWSKLAPGTGKPASLPMAVAKQSGPKHRDDVLLIEVPQ